MRMLRSDGEYRIGMKVVVANAASFLSRSRGLHCLQDDRAVEPETISS
jgi:hypothetical protein